VAARVSRRKRSGAAGSRFVSSGQRFRCALWPETRVFDTKYLAIRSKGFDNAVIEDGFAER
jgi:hypothetical protein